MTERPRIIERPWGRYREYARNEPCTVWIVEMKPGEAGSLQSHRNFDELWIMLTDGAEVQVGDVVSHPQALEEIFIPRGTKHRLMNPGDQLLRMMEVAYGEVQDADKVRYEDRYGRA
ncbi:MAG: phosphomannose isomerase type II C-terminal cupin domain [Planctomycetes bacterium]|nr:phosphomannose isomerase type II C-terminal cupin domain [Planctomycetota bacterium]